MFEEKPCDSNACQAHVARRRLEENAHDGNSRHGRRWRGKNSIIGTYNAKKHKNEDKQLASEKKIGTETMRSKKFQVKNLHLKK